MIKIILCLFFVIEIRGFDLKLFNKIGVAIENLKDDLIVTHGYQTIPLRIEMRLPSNPRKLKDVMQRAMATSQTRLSQQRTVSGTKSRKNLPSL